MVRSIEEGIEAAMASIFAGDIDAAQLGLAEMFTRDGHSSEEIAAAMAKADPLGLAWPVRHRPGATGVRGLPILETRYALLSDIHRYEVKTVLPDLPMRRNG
jgi:hypothetical protein